MCRDILRPTKGTPLGRHLYMDGGENPHEHRRQSTRAHGLTRRRRLKSWTSLWPMRRVTIPWFRFAAKATKSAAARCGRTLWRNFHR